jgi:hypothetical protein
MIALITGIFVVIALGREVPGFLSVRNAGCTSGSCTDPLKSGQQGRHIGETVKISGFWGTGLL